MAAWNALIGGVVGTAAVVIAYRTDRWALIPGLVIWGSALVAAGSCDAVTQRVPTALVRQAIVATTVLFGVGLAVYGDWGAIALTGTGALTAGVTMLVCWRYAGAGFGDVRLATLGGVGLGHATGRGLLLGFAAFVVVIVIQIGLVLARGGNRHTPIPFGPALAVGFVLAAAS